MKWRDFVLGFLSCSALGLGGFSLYSFSRHTSVSSLSETLSSFGISSPSLSLYPNEVAYDSLLSAAAQQHSIDWLFAKAILIKESHGNPYLVSSTGAVGLMQLMPRDGAYVTENYRNYSRARNARSRIYEGVSVEQWGLRYKEDLEALVAAKKTLEERYRQDRRFDPQWNIQSGIAQLADEFHYFENKFKKKRYNDEELTYQAMIYAAAAYNAGRGAVERKGDHIPVNHQTEYYVPAVMRIYSTLKQGDGKILLEDLWVLKQ